VLGAHADIAVEARARELKRREEILEITPYKNVYGHVSHVSMLHMHMHMHMHMCM